MILLSARAVAARLSVSRAYLYVLIRDHGFPHPLKLGTRSAWRDDEIGNWIDRRSEARGA